jgi:hypothetical protein
MAKLEAFAAPAQALASPAECPELGGGPSAIRIPSGYHWAQLFSFVTGLIADSGWGHVGENAGHLVGEFPHERINGDELKSYIAPENENPMSRTMPWATTATGSSRSTWWTASAASAASTSSSSTSPPPESVV